MIIGGTLPPAALVQQTTVVFTPRSALERPHTWYFDMLYPSERLGIWREQFDLIYLIDLLLQLYIYMHLSNYTASWSYAKLIARVKLGPHVVGPWFVVCNLLPEVWSAYERPSLGSGKLLISSGVEFVVKNAGWGPMQLQHRACVPGPFFWT